MSLPFTVPVPAPLPAEELGEHWEALVSGKKVRLSNLDKIFWPEEGFTKGDLLNYYYNVSDYIVGYLEARPLTLKRMPGGAGGDFFYEKRAPSHTPKWMPRCTVPGDDGEKPIPYLMVQDAAQLLFVANLGCIEFHPLHSRCAAIDLPDYLFFDLDPFSPATFEDVLAVARHVRAALGALGLPAYPKTSGATGMQVYVPVTLGPTYEQTREFVRILGRSILRADPGRVTMEWEVSKRAGKVFIDHNMNRRGANIVSVYSLRPEPGAPVSTPVTWEEVERGVTPQDFTITNIHERLERLGDLFRGVIDDPVDVREAFAKLGIEVSGPDPASSLETYAEKRDFSVTPEPTPQSGSSDGNSFVIQKHKARRLHYDFRLERGGVLVSWAVPKGLPTVPGERRLAVGTEDHPLEYGGFEGQIPTGQYGAGEVRIFDRGTYQALEWTDDKITVRLEGQRHRGEYHMVKTKQGWLVFLSKSSAGAQPASPPEFAPMLAEGGYEPFDDPAWRFEAKLDGVRTLAYVTTDTTRLISRTGRDQTAQYPELASLAEYVNALSAVIDGEIVAPEEDGRPSFERLQQRINLTGPKEIDRIRRRIPVVLYAFDLLWLDGEDLARLGVQERRARLEEILTAAGPVRLTYYADREGKKFFESAKGLGLEGVIAKRLGSTYQPGRRSKDWRKIKALRTQDCVILGWTAGSGSRSQTFGSLLVGAYEGGAVRWIGQVGTGFTDARLAELMELLREHEVSEPAVSDSSLAEVRHARWVRPVLVCEVEFLEMTKAGKLRAPSFKRLRRDKAPEDCVLELPDV